MPTQTCFARARSSLAIGRARMGGLVADAIESRLVSGPWRVHRQRLDRSEVADPLTIATRSGTPALQGDDPRDLLVLLPEILTCGTDLAVCFAGFNLASRPMAADLKKYAYGDCPVVFISLKVPTTIDVDELIGSEPETVYGDPFEDEDEDEDDDQDAEPEVEVEEEGREELSVQDVAIFPVQGPDFADLDERSHLLTFLDRHFGLLLIGEARTT